MRSRRALLTQLAALGLLAGGALVVRDRIVWPEPRPVFDPKGGGWMPFTLPGRSLITVLVGVGETPVHALVDSGAQYTTIDRAAAEAMGLLEGLSMPMVAMGVGGGGQVAQSVTLDLDLGGVRVPGLRAAALDLGGLSEAIGLPTPLIIGFDVLSTLIAEIDFASRQLRFRPRQGFTPPAGAVPAPVRRKGRALLAQVTLEGAPMEVLVDTGATGFIGLSAAAAEAAGLTARPIRQEPSVVLGGVTLTQVIQIERFGFAGQEYRNIEAHILQLPNVPGFPKGLLGLDSLRLHHVLLDVGGGRMLLSPPSIVL